jgi:dCTP deaminase
MGILADWQIARDVGITDAQPNEKRHGKISYGYTSYGYDARVGYKFKVFSPIMCKEIDPKDFDPNALVEVDLTPLPCDPVWVSGGNMRSPGYWRCRACNYEVKADHTAEEVGKYFPPTCNVKPPDHILVPPHSFVLGETVEEFTIPRDCLCIVVGKSTYARCGLVVNVTPGEPEWKGKWTVEISNTAPLPARVYCGEGIMQCLFFRTDGYRETNTNDIRNILQSAGNYREDLATFVFHNATCSISYADKKGKYQNQDGLTLPTVDKKE